MKKLLVIGLLALLLGFLAIFLLDRFLVAPRTPKFTLGADTTLLTAPLHPDGTVNYLPAINDLLSQGVTSENNAAIPLLQAGIAPDSKEFKRPFMSALKVPAPQPGQTLINFIDFAKSSPNPPDDATLTEIETIINSRPWTPAEFLLADAWLKRNEKAFALLETACDRPNFYLPIAGDKSPPASFDVIPPIAFLRWESKALLARAMCRAGTGELSGALADIRRLRHLARLCDQAHMAITRLVAVAVDTLALRAYRAIFLSREFSASQLADLREEVTSLPPFPHGPDLTDHVEHLLSLEFAMALIRGDDKVIHNLAGDYEKSHSINLGNLHDLDWNIALREINQTFDEDLQQSNLPFLKRIREYEVRLRQTAQLKTPGTPMLDTDNVGVPAVEAFLKKRPGESTADYSRRIGRWLFEGSPNTNLRYFKFTRGPDVHYDLTLLALQLEQYRLAHGTYPDKLSDLGTDLPKDLFADAPFHYRRDQKGYTLWSVAFDGIDNNASGDDIVIKSEKPDK